MNNIKVKNFLKRNFFWIIIIGYLAILSLINYNEDIFMENNGVIVLVTVEYNCQVSFDRGGAMYPASKGYYYANNKRYSCFSKLVLPIGSTFKIKYNPKNPKMWRYVDE